MPVLTSAPSGYVFSAGVQWRMPGPGLQRRAALSDTLRLRAKAAGRKEGAHKATHSPPHDSGRTLCAQGRNRIQRRAPKLQSKIPENVATVGGATCRRPARPGLRITNEGPSNTRAH